MYIKKGKKVVEIQDDCYVTKRNYEKHLMKIYDACGISESIIVDLVRKGIKHVKVFVSKDKYYITTIPKLQEHSIKKSWAGETQWFLPLKWWEEKEKGVEQEVLFSV